MPDPIKLTDPFPSSAVGKLPKLTCRDCSNANGKVCNNHNRRRCRTCKNNISDAHVHIDFVGHAHVTERLLTVDPAWTWEPTSLDTNGVPVLDRNGGLWIRLTVNGVTRPGYGDAPGKSGGNAVKEAIGDALRNAAMRFGVALDLWKKDVPDREVEEPAGRGGEQAPAESAPQQQTEAQIKAGLRNKIMADYQRRGIRSVGAVTDEFAEWSRGVAFKDADNKVLQQFLDHLSKTDGVAPTGEESPR